MHKFVENLLNGEKVEFKALGEVAELRRGRVISKQYLEEYKGIYPVYSSQTANNGEIGRINSYDFDGEFVNWTTDGANAGTVFYRNGKFSITNVSGLIKIKDTYILTYKFLFYYLSIVAKNYVNSGMGNPKLMSNQIEKIKISLPPLSAQKRIVEILDKFTNLMAELTAELTLRKKQFQYYRDFLLSENNLKKSGFQWKKLGEVVEILTAKTKIKTKDYCKSGKMPIIDQGDSFIAGYTNDDCIPIPNGNYIIFGDHSEHIKFIDFSFVQGADGIKILKTTTDNPKYIYYAFQNFYKKELSYKRHWSKAKETIIPIPPLEKQLEIVNILDKFDKLTNSISEGLPKEIELREKQYRYYRDLLLNFEE